MTQCPRESAEPWQLGLDPTALPSSALGGCLELPLRACGHTAEESSLIVTDILALIQISMENQSQTRADLSAAKRTHGLAKGMASLSGASEKEGELPPSKRSSWFFVDKQVSVT